MDNLKPDLATTNRGNVLRERGAGEGEGPSLVGPVVVAVKLKPISATPTFDLRGAIFITGPKRRGATQSSTVSYCAKKRLVRSMTIIKARATFHHYNCK